ncbi:MAG: hypothetical protein OEQ18_11270 [Gammaproteobacteria bacterium]|nr:hypothetical protein [Gammaproteobacteria bacterium]
MGLRVARFDDQEHKGTVYSSAMLSAMAPAGFSVTLQAAREADIEANAVNR